MLPTARGNATAFWRDPRALQLNNACEPPGAASDALHHDRVVDPIEAVISRASLDMLHSNRGIFR
jgi:hypothetical protein